MILTNNSFDSVSHWINTIRNVDILQNKHCTDLFDQNGYHLTLAEQSYADVNGYNQDVEFSINNMTFKAGYLIGGDVVEDFCREICFDKSTQETQRRFFDNFNQVLKYANN